MVNPTLRRGGGLGSGPSNSEDYLLDEDSQRDDLLELKKADKKGLDPSLVVSVRDRLNELATHLSILEDRYANLRKKVNLIERNLVEHQRESHSDLKAMRRTVTEMNHKVEDVKNKIGAISGELKNVVSREEFMVVKKYLDFWEPMAFLTVDDAKRMIREVVDELLENEASFRPKDEKGS